MRELSTNEIQAISGANTIKTGAYLMAMGFVGGFMLMNAIEDKVIAATNNTFGDIALKSIKHLFGYSLKFR